MQKINLRTTLIHTQFFNLPKYTLILKTWKLCNAAINQWHKCFPTQRAHQRNQP